jgi:hypothetical protein
MENEHIGALFQGFAPLFGSLNPARIKVKGRNRTLIRITVTSRILIRMKVTSRILFRIKVMRIRNTGKETKKSSEE